MLINGGLHADLPADYLEVLALLAHDPAVLGRRRDEPADGRLRGRAIRTRVSGDAGARAWGAWVFEAAGRAMAHAVLDGAPVSAYWASPIVLLFFAGVEPTDERFPTSLLRVRRRARAPRRHAERARAPP